MSIREKALFHQIHPAKLATDISSGIASTGLMWRHETVPALLVGLLPSILISAMMLRFMDFKRQRDSALGRYLAHRMTPVAQGVRALGQIAMWVAAWAHSAVGIGIGLLVIIAAWIHGVLPPWRQA